MTRIALIAVAAASLVAAGVATPAATKASVGLAKRSPVTVTGAGFQPRERVTVRVTPLGRISYAKVVTATATGRVTAVFAGRTIGDCVGVRVVAVGNGGSRAVRWELPPPGACGIEPAP